MFQELTVAPVYLFYGTGKLTELRVVCWGLVLSSRGQAVVGDLLLFLLQ